jgi:SAM-dependent methyltransferase
MIQEEPPSGLRGLFHQPRVLDFARQALTDGYAEAAGEYAPAMRDLMGRAFDTLIAARHDEQVFRAAVQIVATDIFCKGVPSFWFNQIYTDYKRSFKPQRRYDNLRPWLQGQRVLDLGCGDGRLALLLHQHGYQVGLTDVLDYRAPEARDLPFARTDNPRVIPYPDASFDSAIVMAVLHHVEAADLPPLLAGLRRVTRRVIVEEDCYNIPSDLPGLAETLRGDPLLREYGALSAGDQQRFLMFIDYFANAITQGLPQMDMPFNFRSVRGWQALFEAQGFAVQAIRVPGFQKGFFNRSCHVWFILDTK